MTQRITRTAHEDAISSSRGKTATPNVPSAVRELLLNMIHSYHLPVAMDFWGKDAIGTSSAPELTLHFKHPGVLRNLITAQDRIFLTECWLNHFFEFDGSTETMIEFSEHLSNASFDKGLAIRAWIQAHFLPKLHLNQLHATSIRQQQAASAPQKAEQQIQHHYDVSNEFYQLVLDPTMTYSCAHFERDDMNLEEAQHAKMDLICRKLMLKPGDRLLDVGCGWGSLLRWAAKYYGVTGYGITLSKEQFEYAKERNRAEGLDSAIHVELRDYRHLPANAMFDKIVSVGMIEHVGVKNYPEYFATLLSVLSPGGLFLCHGIATRNDSFQRDINSEFINKYIFPGGQLGNIDEVLRNARQNGWEVVDVDGWRPHYGRTLRSWAQNLEKNKDAAIELVGDSKVKLWQLYMISSARGFEENWLEIYQTLFRKRADSKWDLPWVRRGWLA